MSSSTLATMQCIALCLLKPWWAVLGSRCCSTMHANYPDTSVSLAFPLSFQSPPNSHDHALFRIKTQNNKQRTVELEHWQRTSDGPVKKKKMELAWHTLWRNDDSIAKQALQWTPQGLGDRGRPKNNWKRDLEKDTWTAGFKCSWRKMEVAAEDRAGWNEVVYGRRSTGSDKA